MSGGNLEIIRSNKGHHKVIHKGFMYTKHKAMGTKIRWRCVQRASHCKGSIFTSSHYQEPVVTVTHNHLADLEAVEFARTRTVFVDQMSLFPPLDIGYTFKEQKEDGSLHHDSLHSVTPKKLQRAIRKIVPPQIGKMVTPASQPATASAPRRIQMKVLAPKPTSPPPPPPPPEVCLRWNSYHSNMQATFPALLTSQRYVDVTLACEGRSIQCHKMMLSACSTYFDELLSQNPCQHPIVLMKDLKFWEIQALVDFMYRGEVNVSQDKLPSLLAAAEALQIKGLAGPASVPGPSSHDEHDDSPAPLLEHFADGDMGGALHGGGSMGGGGLIGSSQARRIRKRRIIAHAQTAKNAVSPMANMGQQQRSVLAPGRKRKMEPLPQPMRIKLEPPDEQESENEEDADEDKFTIDTTAIDTEQEETAGDTDPGPATNNSRLLEPDLSFDDEPNPILPEVVMAPDQASN